MKTDLTYKYFAKYKMLFVFVPLLINKIRTDWAQKIQYFLEEQEWKIN